MESSIPDLDEATQPDAADERPPRAERPARATPSPAAAAPPAPRTSEFPRAQRPGAPRPAIHAHPIDLERIDPDAVKVLRRLTRAGYTAYLVGGGVRDLLLDRRPKDFDIATSARPNEVRNLFRNCRIIGRRFRLAHILFGGGKVIETATFRKDPTEALDLAEGEAQEEFAAFDAGEDASEASSDGESENPLDGTALVPRRKKRDDDADLLIRHDNVFGEPHEDAIRRDFTINGLFYDLEREEVIDYVGGMTDLERRVVRTIGEPDVRFREDPIRMLRAIKFSARCDLGLSPEVYDAIIDNRQELEKSAPPRVLEEVLRLLRGGAAHRSIWLAWDTGMLHVVLPELAAYLDDQGAGTEALFGRLRAIDARTRDFGVPTDAVLLAALLLEPTEEAMDGESDLVSAYDDFIATPAERLAIPRRMRDRMRLVMLAQRRLRTGRHASVMRRDFFPEAALLFSVDRLGRGETVPTWATDALDGPRREASVPRSPAQSAREERRPAPRVERLERAARAPIADVSAFGDAPFGESAAPPPKSDAPPRRPSSRVRAPAPSDVPTSEETRHPPRRKRRS
jgi:poly(A) polymerase